MGWLKLEGNMNEVEELKKRIAGLEEDVNTLSGILLDFVKKAGLVSSSKPADAISTKTFDTTIPPHLANPVRAESGFTSTASANEDYSNDDTVGDLSSVFLDSNNEKAEAEKKQAEMISKMSRK